MENTKFIEIVFENIESIVVPIERVISMEFGKLEPVEDDPLFGLFACRAEYVLLEITYKNESELQYNTSDYDEPLGMYAANPTSNYVEDRPNILGRILYHDISVIELLNEDKQRIKNIYVPWNEEDEYSNRFMTTEAKNGILKIEIRER
ncbi:hypothetical protein [Bacillus smithii]|uniref:hypothetical protein n=1 Tax=Bacillus smithii TaxID=1479 RepID=UPI002E24A8CB|nr:hypothetical protein [Bacillus smithii]MED4929175.1 hypothetical protein [Bacillus smithii]